MSIDSLTHSRSSHRTHRQQIRQDLSAIQTDLQSSNLTQAQTDFATLLNDAPRLKSALSGSAASGSSSATSPLSSLSTALQSGDITGASTALSSLEQTMGSVRHHHHHHHHQGGAGNPAGSNEPVSPTVQNDLQILSGALQSGNLTAAQQALTQLENDDPALATVPAPATSPAGGTAGTTIA